MGISRYGLTYKQIGERQAATIRQPVTGREEIHRLLLELAKAVPPENRAGDFFWINHYINSLEQGLDAEVGVPVLTPIEQQRVTTRTVAPIQVLTTQHEGPAATIGESYRQYAPVARELGLISEEFLFESFPDVDCVIDGPIEVQYVLHDWGGLFKKHLTRVVGEEAAGHVFGEMDKITIETPLELRNEWTLCAVSRLAEIGDEFSTYDAVSSCAHVFPDTQTAKLNKVYQAAIANGGDKIAAIDAVLVFMDRDPGWAGEIYREGEVIYTAKNPRDRAAYDAAETEAERRRAYCFCPLIREHLDEAIPPEFCYCGSGWYRKQWQDASGKPVSIEIIKSLTKGDDRCQYAITIMD